MSPQDKGNYTMDEKVACSLSHPLSPSPSLPSLLPLFLRKYAIDKWCLKTFWGYVFLLLNDFGDENNKMYYLSETLILELSGSREGEKKEERAVLRTVR